MVDGPRAALSTVLVFWLIVGAGPAYRWVKTKVRKSIKKDIRSSYNTIIYPDGKIEKLT